MATEGITHTIWRLGNKLDITFRAPQHMLPLSTLLDEIRPEECELKTYVYVRTGRIYEDGKRIMYEYKLHNGELIET